MAEFQTVIISGMSLAEFPDIQALSNSQKLELIDEIWKSVDAHADFLEVNPAEKELLDERWSTFLRMPETALSVDEFRARLRTSRS